MLEFDLDGGGAPPASFATLPAGRAIAESALLILAAELHDDLSIANRTALARAAAAQREGESWITHVGMMSGRAGRPLRINAGARSPAGLRAFAEAVGCDAPQCALFDTLLALIHGLPLSLILALDLDSGPLPRLGLECYAHPPENAAPALLERLVGEGLCSPAQAEALLAWPEESGEGLALIEPYRSLDALLGPDGLAPLVRTLNHVKLVAEPGGAFEAKAYLGACYRPGRQSAATELAA